METERDWDILIMEIEEENQRLIEEFYTSRMRKRDRNGSEENDNRPRNQA